MEELRRNTTVGGFMIIGLCALGWLMTSFGELPAFLGGGEYELVIEVNELTGVGEGAPIVLSGVQVGRIKSLRFKDPGHLDAGVQIVGAIKKGFDIPATTEAIVQPKGFGLGRGEVILKVAGSGKAPPLPPGEIIRGKMGSFWEGVIPPNLLVSVERAAEEFANFVQALTPVADDLHDLLEKHPVAEVDGLGQAQRLVANISTVVERFDGSLKAFNELFGDARVKGGWFEIIDNVREMTAGGRASFENLQQTSAQLRTDLQRLAAKLEGGIDNANTRVDEVAADLRRVLENAAVLTGYLVNVSRTLSEGEGTAGKFVHDPKLYESLLLTAERLTQLIDTIQRMADRFERDGAIGVNYHTTLGPVRTEIDVPESNK